MKLFLVFLMFLSAQQIYCCKKKKKVELYSDLKLQDSTTVIDVKLSTVLSSNRMVKLAHIEMLEDDRAVRFEWSNSKTAEVKLQKEADECIYRGSLLEDEHSKVLVTGCFDDERSIQIQSQVYGDTLGVGRNGAVEDVGRKSHHQSDDAVDNNHDFLEQFPFDSSSSRKIPEFPASLDLPLQVYLSPSWRSQFPQGGGVNQAKEVLRHVKEMFHHPSLDTRFNLKYTDKDFLNTSAELQPTRSGIRSLSGYITEPADRSAIVYLSAGKIEAGRVGQAVRLSICDRDKKKPRSITLWDELTIFTAQTVAHEIGHSLGFFHDFQIIPKILTGRTRTCGPGQTSGGPDNQLMNYGYPMENSWSNCTNEDFRNYYFWVTSEHPFCLNEPGVLILDNWTGQCVVDNNDARLLAFYIEFWNTRTQNEPQICRETCAAKGFSLSGVQFRTQCFCGNTPPPGSSFAPEADCNTPCPGNRKEMCGAANRMNVYFTGCCGTLNVMGQTGATAKYGKYYKSEDYNGKAVYRHDNGNWCIFYGRHWKVEACDWLGNDKSQGYIWTKSSDICPEDVGLLWRYYTWGSGGSDTGPIDQTLRVDCVITT